MRDYAETVNRLRNWPRVCVEYKNSVDELHDDAADAIEELLENDHRQTLLLRYRAEKIKELESAVPKWISVEELLPPVYKVVLSCDKYGLVKENYMISDKDWSVGYHITHWMPLPAPPKGVE